MAKFPVVTLKVGDNPDSPMSTRYPPMTGLTQEQFTHLHDRAYEAMDQGALGEASQHFAELLQHRPDAAHYHYMRGLAHKYLMDWPTALRHNLRAIELGNGKNEAEHWNAAIAATALGQWEQARQLWKACGVRIDEGSGPIDDDFGVAVVRLNPWHGGETVFMRRIDPVRARLLNVPLPESGHRFGDIVLHDGASTGTRFDGDRQVPVFNELERLVPSGFQTFAAFVSCDSPTDLKDLLAASAPGIGFAEDWTGSITYYCLRCSYGAPHKHSENADNQWQPERNLGIAAQSRLSVEKLLEDWAAKGAGRSIEGIETRELAAPEPEEGSAWWCGPEDEEDAEEGGA